MYIGISTNDIKDDRFKNFLLNHLTPAISVPISNFLQENKELLDLRARIKLENYDMAKKNCLIAFIIDRENHLHAIPSFDPVEKKWDVGLEVDDYNDEEIKKYMDMFELYNKELHNDIV